MNYSKKQYEIDKKIVKDRKKFNELYQKWIRVSESCYPGMVNPPAAVERLRIQEKELANEIKLLTKIKKKVYSVGYGRDKDFKRVQGVEPELDL